MEPKNYVSIRLTPSSLMTLDGAIAHMCHDTRATRPGYLRTDEDAGCYWFYGNGEEPFKLHDTPPTKDDVKSYLTLREHEMKKRSDNTPRGKNGHLQTHKINTRWFMQGIVTFSSAQVEKTNKFDILECSLKFLKALATKFKTEITWAAIHNDETTIHLQYGMDNLDSDGHTVQRRINQRKDVGERNHLMTPQELQDMAGVYFAPLGFRRGISRDITGAVHKTVRDMHRAEQAKMEKDALSVKSEIDLQKRSIAEFENTKNSAISNILDLHEYKRSNEDDIKKLKDEGRKLRRSNDELRSQTAEERKRITDLQHDVRSRRRELEIEKLKIEEEIQKIQDVTESKKLLQASALIESEKRDRAHADETLIFAKEQEIIDLYGFLNTISSHSGGLFALQKEGHGYYTGNHYWSAPEIISISYFVQNYAAMKEQNILGDQYHIRMIGTPAIFCLDDVNKESIDRMRDYGITPLAAVQTSPENYQVWIKFDHEGILPANKWHAVNTFLIDKFGADCAANALNHAFRCPGFKSYKHEREGYLVKFDPELMDSNADLKSFGDVWNDIPAFTKENTIRKTAQRGCIIPEKFFEGTETPDWFIDKWQERRADLISSKHCPKRKDGTPDDSTIDYLVSKGFLQPYLQKRPEVLQQRLCFCFNMLVLEAENVKRLHRKNNPQNYATTTLNAITRDLGIKNTVAINKSADIDR